jgi:hypothetical protein
MSELMAQTSSQPIQPKVEISPFSGGAAAALGDAVIIDVCRAFTVTLMLLMALENPRQGSQALGAAHPACVPPAPVLNQVGNILTKGRRAMWDPGVFDDFALDQEKSPHFIQISS